MGVEPSLDSPASSLGLGGETDFCPLSAFILGLCHRQSTAPVCSTALDLSQGNPRKREKQCPSLVILRGQTSLRQWQQAVTPERLRSQATRPVKLFCLKNEAKKRATQDKTTGQRKGGRGT